MAARWLRNKRTGGLRADLGHGLEMRIWHEGIERLPANVPIFNVMVFGQKLETRAIDEREGKARAEAIAKSWIAEARIKL